jgi:hypothetical protein
MRTAHQHFRLEISFSETTSEPVAAYLQVRSGEVAETREVEEGVAFADYDAGGTFLGIELLAPCPVAVLDQIIQGEPEPIRRFIRGVAPQQFLQQLIRV